MSKGVVLFADNDPRFLKVRKEFLEKEGYRVIPAADPTEARRILEQKQVDLAILNIRLLDDTDQKDISGLTLAKETASSVPKIMLTGFPTWKAVKEALGPHVDGVPAAVDFVSKQEGPEAMVQAVDLTLRRPQLKANLLHAFEAVTLMALPWRIADLGSEEASRRFQKSLETTSQQLTKHREQENRRASQYHFWGLSMAILGMLVVLASAILILLGRVAPTTLPLVGSALSEAVGIFFFVREDSAHKRVNTYFTQLNELNYLGNLLTICDTLQSPSDREEYKKKIIDRVLEGWSGRQTYRSSVG
jgi:DNA-binding response OmpR family regulator